MNRTPTNLTPSQLNRQRTLEGTQSKQVLSEHKLSEFGKFGMRVIEFLGWKSLKNTEFYKDNIMRYNEELSQKTGVNSEWFSQNFSEPIGGKNQKTIKSEIPESENQVRIKRNNEKINNLIEFTIEKYKNIPNIAQNKEFIKNEFYRFIKEEHPAILSGEELIGDRRQEDLSMTSKLIEIIKKSEILSTPEQKPLLEVNKRKIAALIGNKDQEVKNQLNAFMQKNHPKVLSGQENITPDIEKSIRIQLPKIENNANKINNLMKLKNVDQDLVVKNALYADIKLMHPKILSGEEEITVTIEKSIQGYLERIISSRKSSK